MDSGSDLGPSRDFPAWHFGGTLPGPALQFFPQVLTAQRPLSSAPSSVPPPAWCSGSLTPAPHTACGGLLEQQAQRESRAATLSGPGGRRVLQPAFHLPCPTV